MNYGRVALGAFFVGGVFYTGFYFGQNSLRKELRNECLSELREEALRPENREKTLAQLIGEVERDYGIDLVKERDVSQASLVE